MIRTGSKGVILEDYTERMTKRLIDGGIAFARRSFKEIDPIYGNGEGWYAVSVGNIFDWVEFVKYKSLFEIRDESKLLSLHDCLTSCVEGFLACSKNKGGPKSVLLIGERHADLMTLAFQEQGVDVEWVDRNYLEGYAERSALDLNIYFKGQKKCIGKYIIDLDAYFTVYKK